MSAEDNAAAVRSGYEAFAKGDLETVAGLFAPDITWHIGGRNQLTGDYKGQEQVFGFFGKLTELSGGSFTIEMHDLLASDDHVVALVRESAERNGRTIEANEAHVWHVADGKATEFWGLTQDSAALDDFWS